MVVHSVQDNEGRVLLEMLDWLRQGAAGSSNVTVHILAAADHDGVCSSKILVTMLQRAEVKHTVFPVTGNTEVIDHVKQLEGTEADLQLTLYKHWILEESIMHSSYFHGVMELHRDKGRRSLHNFFATGGIPPSEYKQLYSGMQLPIQRSLHQTFRDHGRAYGLTADKMFLQQFVRSLGPLGDSNPALSLHELSCGDAVHVVTALLAEVPPALCEARTESLPKTIDGKRDLAAVNELERQARVDNFWRAFDAVLCKEPEPLRDGISGGVGVAQAVQSLARQIKDGKLMQGSRLFRWCRIEHAPDIFRHHLAVRRLAVWLLSVLFTYQPGGTSPERPLLLMVRDSVRDTYLCVGATPMRIADGQDEFGARFRSVLRADRSLKYRYDFFDKSCIEIAAEDYDRFWELMQESIV